VGPLWERMNGVIEVGRRRKAQAPPVHVVQEALLEPNRDPARQWLVPREDEQMPRTRLEQPGVVTWADLWPARPDALVRFDVEPGGAGTELTWTLFVEEPVPDAGLVGHLCKRLNQLVNAELRYSFGQ
jgi:hypothetical protein